MGQEGGSFLTERQSDGKITILNVANPVAIPNGKTTLCKIPYRKSEIPPGSGTCHFSSFVRINHAVPLK